MRKRSLSTVTLILILPVAILFISCSKNAVQPNLAQESPAELPEAEATDTSQEVAQNDATAPETETVEFVNRNIHFEFDSAVLTDQAQRILAGTASYLRDNPGLTVTIEGHCDERGTEAYNMALGDQRAKSAKGFLEYMGISVDRLRTVSYGEERPISLKHDVLSWTENRRAQFVIQ